MGLRSGRQFTKASNEQLKCSAVTSFTGKLKAVKNG
jgi:hypothetical protein